MEQKFFTGKFLFAVFLVLGLSDLVFGYAGGVANVTQKSGTSGCSCHSKNSSLSVVIAGPSTLAPSATGMYTVTVTQSGSFNSGVDIAASNGTLAVADAVLKVNGSDLTHQNNNKGTGSLVYNFKYTAPSTIGNITLYATAAGSSSSKPAWNFAPNFSVSVTSATDVSERSNFQRTFGLIQNYPNPFNPSTTIDYEITQNSFVTLKVFDVSGKEIRTLVNQNQNIGQHKVLFNAGDLVSGVYVYRLTSGNLISTKKLILTK